MRAISTALNQRSEYGSISVLPVDEHDSMMYLSDFIYV